MIKSAVVHGKPKVVESANFFLHTKTEPTEANGAVLENKLAVAATCAVMLEENKRKAANILNEAQSECGRILETAKAEANKIIEKAKLEAEEIKKNAFEEGKNQGYAEGQEEGRLAAEEKMCEMITATNEKAERTIQLAEKEKLDSVLAAEAEIVTIAMAVAEKVIPQHFIDAPQVIFPLVKAALEKVKDQNSIVIKVSPENYEFVLMAKNELQMIVDGEEEICIVSDQLLKNDGCIVESANGNVDARLETQMAIVKKAVQEVMR